MLVDKKGISPLIATILLVAFVIILFILLVDWTKIFIKDTEEKIKAQGQLICLSDVSLNIMKACNTGNKVDLTLENRNKRKIDAFLVRVDENDPKLVEPMYPLDSYETKFLKSVEKKGSTASVLPIINLQGINIPCSGKVISKKIEESC